MTGGELINLFSWQQIFAVFVLGLLISVPGISQRAPFQITNISVSWLLFGHFHGVFVTSDDSFKVIHFHG